MYQPPEHDIEIATRVGAVFQVVTKTARGAPWTNVGGQCSVREAFALASSLSDFEIGVLRICAEGSGSIYWTSKHPAIFNDTVIDQPTGGYRTR